MKELSVEQKAKAYDEAKLRISAVYNSNRCTIDFMNEIFPELKENEDEKIKNKLINLIKMSSEVGGLALHKWEADEMLTWLEKQSEKSLTVDIKSMIEAYEQRLLSQCNGVRNSPFVNMCVEAFKHGVENTLDELHLKQGEKKPYGQREECLDCQVNYAGECKGFCELKRNEHNPAWSEEDERMFRSLHNLIYVVRDCDCDSSEKKELSDWLKSLKDRIGE